MSSNNILCKMCKYIYTDSDIFQLGKVNEGFMKITCPHCGKFNIYKPTEFMGDFNASGRENSD